MYVYIYIHHHHSISTFALSLSLYPPFSFSRSVLLSQEQALTPSVLLDIAQFFGSASQSDGPNADVLMFAPSLPRWLMSQMRPCQWRPLPILWPRPEHIQWPQLEHTQWPQHIEVLVVPPPKALGFIDSKDAEDAASLQYEHVFLFACRFRLLRQGFRMLRREIASSAMQRRMF